MGAEGAAGVTGAAAEGDMMSRSGREMKVTLPEDFSGLWKKIAVVSGVEGKFRSSVKGESDLDARPLQPFIGPAPDNFLQSRNSAIR